MPHEVSMPLYECDYCKERFTSNDLCKTHELRVHLCPECEHRYYVQDWEPRCARKENGSKCEFTPKETQRQKFLNELTALCDKYKLRISAQAYLSKDKTYISSVIMRFTSPDINLEVVPCNCGDQTYVDAESLKDPTTFLDYKDNQFDDIMKELGAKDEQKY